MIYRDDGMVKIINGDCRHMAEIADDSVHCVVTSPPYWGLRKYDGVQELVWGGAMDCKHVWSGKLQQYQRGNVGSHSTLQGSRRSESKNGSLQIPQGQFCSICGAWKGSFGLEPSIQMYIEHTIEVLEEIRRVLRKDGVVFWNIGDSYASGKGTCFNPGGGKGSFSTHGDRKDAGVYPLDRGNVSALRRDGLKPKDACLIPFRVALAAQTAGWWVRSVIVWNKANPMPESVNGWRWEKHRIKVAGRGPRKQKANLAAQADYGNSFPDKIGGVYQQHAEFVDCPGCPKCEPNGGLILRRGSWRPTDSHEYILMLVKSSQYYCDMEAVREPQTGNAHSRGSESGNAAYQEARGSYKGFSSPVVNWPGGRNLRSVWSFPTVPYPGGHFATFPETLPETCIKAATPEYGVCANCGAPWARVMEKGLTDHAEKISPKTKQAQNATRMAQLRTAARERGSEYVNESKTVGWKAVCKCNTDVRIAATVLDPFMGSGTTLSVAKRLGRRSVGYDLSMDYAPLADERAGPPVMELV